ncbi:hypothetical protein KM043_013937 [Ampulex compressa]|nr:hypothetical protein KM043_013937 [Ampulex compressa]
MDRWANKVAIVTGASAGIGIAIVEALVKQGLTVVGVGRRVELIRQLASRLTSERGKLYPMACDVTKEEDILSVFRWVEEELGGADILVNNAGIIHSQPITDSTTEKLHEIMNINVIAVAVFIREAVKSMKKRKAKGHILNINSVAGHCAAIIRIPLSLYPASKYAVTALTASVRNELSAAKLDIRITSISPGAVDTDMLFKAIGQKDIAEAMAKLKSKDVAEAVIYALSAPPGAEVCEITLVPHEGSSTSSNPAPWRN